MLKALFHFDQQLQLHYKLFDYGGKKCTNYRLVLMGRWYNYRALPMSIIFHTKLICILKMNLPVHVAISSGKSLFITFFYIYIVGMSNQADAASISTCSHASSEPLSGIHSMHKVSRVYTRLAHFHTFPHIGGIKNWNPRDGTN